MNCENCKKETENPKYCSKSCAAIVNNRTIKKRQPQGECFDCGSIIRKSRKYCNKCWSIQKHIPKNNKSKNPRINLSLNCTVCNTVKTNENTKINSKGRIDSRCYQCISELANLRHRAFKTKCVNYKGGKCEKCGYDKCIDSLQFHHKNPENKLFAICTKNFYNQEVENELNKCAILCANCHFEEHSSVDNSDVREVVLEYFLSRLEI